MYFCLRVFLVEPDNISFLFGGVLLLVQYIYWFAYTIGKIEMKS